MATASPAFSKTEASKKTLLDHFPPASLLAIGLTLGGMIGSVVTTKVTVGEHERRITVLEEKTIQRPEFDEYKRGQEAAAQKATTQLQRIEDKLDKLILSRAR